MTATSRKTPGTRTQGRAASRPKPRDRRLNQLILFAFIAGIAIHPVLIEFSEHFFSPLQEIFLLAAAVGLTFGMFLMSKSHLICSLMHAGGILANTLTFFFTHLDGGLRSIFKNMDYEWCFRVIIMWCGGVTVTVLIRLLAHKKWNASHIRKTFGKGFLCSSIVFVLLYCVLLADLFVLQRNLNFGNGSLNLKPFKGAFALYWPLIKSGKFSGGVFVQFFGNILIFTPLGFYLALWWRGRGQKWIMVLIPFLLAGGIEAVQYLLHLGESDIDDAWMNVVGYFVGILICVVLDFIRTKVTHGKERTIFKI